MSTMTTLLEIPEGFRSPTVARFMWQLDAQRRLTLDAVKDLDVAALGWQPARGMNTIGMLLAHLAYSESHLVQVGIEAKASSDTKTAIGLSVEEEGMPLAPDAPPAPALDGRDLAFFTGLLERARAHTRRVVATLDDEGLARRITRERPDGSKRVFDVGWILYHMVEHEAGHRGQILLLRHLREATARA